LVYLGVGSLTGRLGFAPPMDCVDEFRVLCHRDQCCTDFHRHQLHISSDEDVSGRIKIKRQHNRTWLDHGC